MGTLSERFCTALQDAEGTVVILFPTWAQFHFWARELVGETLGHPERVAGRCWHYPNGKKVVFMADVPGEVREDGKVRGFDGLVLVCDGYLTDDWLGVVR